MTIPVTPEVEYLINRGKDLQMQLKRAHETWHAINGAIQENNNALSALSKMLLEKEKANGPKDEIQHLDQLDTGLEKAPEVSEKVA